MAIFPLPPGLIARLNVPPTYQTATTDTAPPPAYNTAPPNRMPPLSPESTPLPPSPLPSSSAAQIPPPEYSPSVYSQHQRFSQYLPPISNPDPDRADLDPSSPVRSAVKSGRIQQQQQQQQYHASQFQESWRDLENGVHATDAAGAGAEAEVVVAKGEGGEGTKGKKSVFRLYPPIKDGEVKRLYWKRGIVAVGFAMVVVVVVAVVVGVGVYGRR